MSEKNIENVANLRAEFKSKAKEAGMKEPGRVPFKIYQTEINKIEYDEGQDIEVVENNDAIEVEETQENK